MEKPPGAIVAACSNTGPSLKEMLGLKKNEPVEVPGVTMMPRYVRYE
jgi:hypothetical protein